MIIRAILPEWALNTGLPKVQEGEFDDERVAAINSQGYNIYYLPNTPTIYTPGKMVSGEDIDNFKWLFVDMDLKDGKHDRESFLNEVLAFELEPTRIVDSGNGIHVYWEVADLDPMGYLRLQRRLMRRFDTDPAVCTIYQLMRLSGTLNTKVEGDFKHCTLLQDSFKTYSAEQVDNALPILSKDDEEYCTQHFNKTYGVGEKLTVDEALPVRFGALLRESAEVRDLWTRNWDGTTDDRSKADYRIAHIMFAAGFKREEAMSVLVNSSKAMERAPKHRIQYADNIVSKIWTYEIEKATDVLSNSVRDILMRKNDNLGVRFECNKLIDDTKEGFKLGQVIGLVAGSGVGKTTFTLNMFMWFAERNPNYDHFFVSLEQPDHEIALRWATMCGENDGLHDKVHILSNYNAEGVFRNLSLDDIKDYIIEFKKKTGKQIGTCVIDHIGALKKQNKNGENQGLMDLCHQMKGFAVETNTMVIMQSQAPREKAGIGDLELNKDAAYGTVFFESYCDYLLTLWQPLKRLYARGAPTVMSFKFCKIRHKKQHLDVLKEDVRYSLYFDPSKEQLREMTQDEETQMTFFLKQAANERKQDKNDVVTYVSRRLESNSLITAD